MKAKSKAKPAETKPAVSYQRFSSLEQGQGDSIRRQDKMRDDWLSWHPEYYLDETLRDEGISGFRGKNAEKGKLAAFLKACRAGTVKPGTLLIIESHDRLTRMPLHDARQLWEGILECGVDILNLKSGRISTKADLNDPTASTIAVWEIYAAHEYSKQLGRRLKSVWDSRREQAKSKPMNNMPPGWIKPLSGGNEWRLIPERVKIVKQVFQLAASGSSMWGIVRHLNREKIPTFGRGKLWGKSSVAKLLTNRAVLGEMQPYAKNDNGQREAVGEPIQGYYPAIIGQQLFDRAQAGMAARSQQRGRKGPAVTNLFTSLVFHAVDGSKIHVRHHRGYTNLVSASADHGVVGKEGPIPFHVEYLENAVLSFLSELKPADINGNRGHAEVENRIEELTGKLAQVEKQIETVKKRMLVDDDNFDALLDTRQTLERERNRINVQIDTCRQQLTTAASVDLAETQKLVELLAQAKGEKLVELREKLRSRIAQIVKEIWILPVDIEQEGRKKYRVAYVQIHLRNGGIRCLVAYSEPRRQREYPGLGIAARGHGFGSTEILRELPPENDLRNYRVRKLGKELRAHPQIAVFMDEDDSAFV